jgi:DNA uptake protein ComE-like DNA-binding protein
MKNRILKSLGLSVGALVLMAGVASAQDSTSGTKRPADSASAKSSWQKDSAMNHGTSSMGAMKTVDVNTATKEQLAAAGWGPYADKIIAGRPYKSMDELYQKQIVPKDAYDKSANKFGVVSGSSK